MAQPGAPAALRGYRLQALYTLKRILSPCIDPSWLFCSEGTEDLDIQSNDGRLIEVIQVKSYSGLVLSDLEPEKPKSFFHRAVSLLQGTTPPNIQIVNLGEIGPEMCQAWEGDEKHRSSITKKLVEKGFQESDAEKFFDRIKLVSLDEESEWQFVLAQIQNLSTGIDAQHAFDLFVAWYYRLAERRETVTYTELVEQINRVGRFLAERHQYHQHWYTTIAPLESHPISDEQMLSLRDEFYAGVRARYDHILAGFDFLRDHKINEIAQAFYESNIVIVHAASGQGKSTLAYRYLHEMYPERWRFAVKRVQDVTQALGIARALSGFAEAVQVPIAVYLDVHPRDAEWPELVKQLAQHPYLEVLVTIREEDYRRANISDVGFEYSDVELEFDQHEAQLIYDCARSVAEQWNFLDFDAAWDAFDGKGPLMEFVYLLTQTQTLRQRLQGQVRRIEEEVRMGASSDELRLLCLVSVASAYGARLYTRELLNVLDLPAANRTLTQFEKEYLLRRSADGFYLEGLHPIRSEILSNLLTQPDIVSWFEIATQAMPLMPEEDLETFILHAFVERPEEHTRLIDQVMTLRPNSWSGIAGILRCLLWAGAKDYVTVNAPAIEAAHEALGPAWLFVVDLDFSSEDEGPKLGEWWTTLGNLIPQERQEHIKAIRQSQTPKATIFRYAVPWLESLEQKPAPPITLDTWKDVAEVWYWGTRLVPHQPVIGWISDEELNKTPETLPLPILADLSLALYLGCPDRHSRWSDAQMPTLHRRLANENNILALENVGSLGSRGIIARLAAFCRCILAKITAKLPNMALNKCLPCKAAKAQNVETTLKIHFIPSDEAPAEATDRLHAETVSKISLVRRLLPTYKRYSSQGYGFKLAGIELPQGDSTQKDGIPLTHLPPPWSTWLNGVVSGVARSYYRYEIWRMYIDEIVNTRELVVGCFLQLNRGLLKYCQRSKPLNVGQKYVDLQDWQRCLDALSQIPDLPKSAVDSWGFTSESNASPLTQIPMRRGYVPNVGKLQRYQVYLKTQREYFASLRNFFSQAPAVWVVNANTGKLHPNDPRKTAILKELDKNGVRTDPHLPVLNLFEAKAALSGYQREFSALFGQHLDKDEIEALESHERKVLAETWTRWYFYAYEPWKPASNPQKQVLHWMLSAKRQLEGQIEQALKSIQTPKCEPTLLDCDQDWQGHPALWIRLNLIDPTEFAKKVLEEFHQTLREILRKVEFGELIYYLIQDTCTYLVIIPVIRGQMLDEFVWPLYTLTFLQTEDLGEKPWSYFPFPLPDKVREALAITLWDIPEIGLANQFSRSVAILRQLTSQISEFQAMPDPTEPGGERLQAYIEKEISPALSDALQTFFDTAAELRNSFNALSKAEQQERIKLCQAIEALSEVHSQVHPGEGDGTFRLDMDELVAYTHRLQQVYPTIEGVRLLWIADILEQKAL